MRVLVTGAGGFIGGRLAALLLKEPALTQDDGRAEQIGELILACRSETSVASLTGDPRVSVAVGDITDEDFLKRLFERRIDSVFHLAAALTAEAEASFERGLHVNILGGIQLLEQCRLQGNYPRLVFASSIAAFGGPLPDPVDDKVAHTPQTSYGTSKAILELLINDYARHRFVDGRSLRTPVVLLRPEPVIAAVVDHIGAVMREPLFGRNFVCCLDPETRIPVASVGNVARALIRLHEIPADRFGHTRALNMPALTVTMGELAEAVAAFDYPGPRGQVSWQQNDEIQGLIESWPRAISAEEALRHGLKADTNVAEILRAFVEDYEIRFPG